MFERERYFGNERLINNSRVMDLVSAINSLNSEITGIAGIRAFRDLPPYERSEIKNLHRLKDYKIGELLILRHDDCLDDEIPVEIYKQPEEEFHPFSRNKINVSLPSQIYPGSSYTVRAELSDIRVRNEIGDSLDLINVVENFEEQFEPKYDFLERTVQEILSIEASIERGMSNYSTQELNQFKKQIIEERLLSTRLNNEVPQRASIRFYLIEALDPYECVRVGLGTRSYDFVTHGKGLGERLSSIGGYD